MDLKNKKVLVVTTTDNMIWQFVIPHIEMFTKQGAKVDCACAKTGFFYDELVEKYNLNVFNINFTRFPFTLKNYKARKELIKLCEKNKYDLIYCHQPVGGVMGRMMGKKFKTKVIYFAHGFHFFKGCPIQNKILYKTIEKHYSKYTDSLITINQEDYEASKKMHAKENYKVNGVGIDFNKYSKDPDFDEKKLKKEIGIKNSDFIVTSIGELNKNKNTLSLLDSMKYLKEYFAKENKDFNIKYLICGQGKLKPEYEQKIKEYNLEENVKMLGFKSDIQKYIQILDVFIMPSHREGLPKTIMECMSFGKPIICSNIRGCRDLVGDNEGGILCEPTNSQEFAEAILKLYNNKDLVEKYSKRNLKEIKKYSLENVLKQIKEIVEEL